MGMKRIWVVVASVSLSVGAASVAPTAAAGSSPPATGRYIVALRDGADVGRTAGDHRHAFDVAVAHAYTHALHGYAATIPVDRVGALAADPRVAAVVPDRPVHAFGRPTP